MELKWESSNFNYIIFNSVIFIQYIVRIIKFWLVKFVPNNKQINIYHTDFYFIIFHKCNLNINLYAIDISFNLLV
jgi:hypothetical protein